MLARAGNDVCGDVAIEARRQPYGISLPERDHARLESIPNDSRCGDAGRVCRRARPWTRTGGFGAGSQQQQNRDVLPAHDYCFNCRMLRPVAEIGMFVILMAGRSNIPVSVAFSDRENTARFSGSQSVKPLAVPLSF